MTNPTLLELDGTRRHDLSKAFTTADEALAYISNDFMEA